MSKVQIIIEGDDAIDALAQLRALAAQLAPSGAVSVPGISAPAAEPSTGNGRGRKKAEAATAEGPFAASPAPAATSSASPADTGSAGGTSEAPKIDLEHGDEGAGVGGDGAEEPTYEELKAAMTAAIERAPNQDPLIVQQALFAATGAKALKHLTTTGAAGGPIIPGKGKAALAALEAVGRS